MKDCRTQDGHPFICLPTHLTFVFHHCWKAVWSTYCCILRRCGYLACESSSTSINAILRQFRMRTTRPPKQRGTWSAAIVLEFAAIRYVSSRSSLLNSKFWLRSGEDEGAGYSVGDCPPEVSRLNTQRDSGSGESTLAAMGGWHMGVYLASDFFVFCFSLEYLFRL